MNQKKQTILFIQNKNDPAFHVCKERGITLCGKKEDENASISYFLKGELCKKCIVLSKGLK